MNGIDSMFVFISINSKDYYFFNVPDITSKLPTQPYIPSSFDMFFQYCCPVQSKTESVHLSSPLQPVLLKGFH